MAAATLILLNVAVAVITARSSKLQELFEGHAILVGRDGQVFDSVLRRCRVSRRDVEGALREADCDLKDTRCAFLEADGRISVLKDSSAM